MKSPLRLVTSPAKFSKTSPAKYTSPSKLKMQLEKEIEELELRAKLIEAECYRFVNSPLPRNFNLYKRYVSYTEDLAQVYKLFNTNKGDPLQLFLRYMQQFQKMQDEKRNRIELLRRKLLLFEETEDEDGNPTNPFHIFCSDYRNSLVLLKSDFNSYYTDLINSLKVARRIMQILIDHRKAIAEKRLKEIDDIELGVRKEYEAAKKEHDEALALKLAKNSMVKQDIFDEKPNPSVVKTTTLKFAEQFAARYKNNAEFIDQFKFIFAKLDNLSANLNRFESKVSTFKAKADEIHEIKQKERLQKLHDQILENTRREHEIEDSIAEYNTKLQKLRQRRGSLILQRPILKL